MSDLSSFLRHCQDSGVVDSEGAFSLGSKARLERIAELVAAEPGQFALKVIQGLVGSGAQTISCEIDRLEFRFEAIGCQHPQPGLLERFSSDIGDRRDPTDDLAYAVLGALRVGLWEVDWQLAGGESVVMRKGGSELREGHDHERTLLRFKFTPASYLRHFSQAVKVRSSVHHLLCTRCQFSAVPLTVDSRLLEPSELGAMYRADDSVVGEREIIMGDRKVMVPVHAKVAYRYWARMDLHGSAERASFSLAPLGERVQSFQDQYKNDLIVSDNATFQAMLYARSGVDGADLPCGPNLPAETGQLESAVYLLADADTPRVCFPVHRGVLLAPTQAKLSHPRAVALFDAQGLDLDASTMAVAENDKFEKRRADLNRHLSRLRSELGRRRSLVPSGAEESFARVSPLE